MTFVLILIIFVAGMAEVQYIDASGSDLDLFAVDNRDFLCGIHNGTCIEPSRCSALFIHRKTPTYTNFFDCNATTICCKFGASYTTVNKSAKNPLVEKVKELDIGNRTMFCDLIGGTCTGDPCALSVLYGYEPFDCDGGTCCYRPFSDVFISGYAVFGQTKRTVHSHHRHQYKRQGNLWSRPVHSRRPKIRYRNQYRRRRYRPRTTYLYDVRYDHDHEFKNVDASKYYGYHGITDTERLCNITQGVCVTPENCATASRYAYDRFNCNSTTICCQPRSHQVASALYTRSKQSYNQPSSHIPYRQIENRTALCDLRNGTCMSPEVCKNHTLFSVLKEKINPYSANSIYGVQRDFYCNLTTICCTALNKAFDIYQLVKNRNSFKPQGLSTFRRRRVHHYPRYNSYGSRHFFRRYNYGRRKKL